MQYKTKWYLITLFSWSLLTALFAYIQVQSRSLTLILVPLYLVPAVFWYVAGRKLEPARALMFLFLVERKLPRLRRSDKSLGLVGLNDPVPEYFFEKERSPDVPGKTVRILVTTLAAVIWVTPLFRFGSDFAALFLGGMLFSWLAVIALSFVLFPLWVYQDAGLKNYDRASGTVSIPGGLVRDHLAGWGIILAIVGFSQKFQDPSLVLSFVIEFLIVILPLSLLASVIFTFHVEPHLVDNFRKTTMIDGIPRGRITFDEM